MSHQTPSSSKPVQHVKRLWWWWLAWSLLVALGIGLGMWQWERAADKRDYLQRLADAPQLVAPEETPPEGSRITLRGEFLADQSYFLDNRVVDGQVGVAALTPLRGDDGRLWLIQRGFVPTAGSRIDPEIDTPEGTVTLSGQWQPAAETALLFGPNQEGRRLQRLALQPWQAALGDFAHPGWVHMGQGPGLFTPWWQPSVMPPSRHTGYAVQWWGLALAALAVMLIGGRRLGRDLRESRDASKPIVREREP
ncbi:SURF1 family protein [Franzmannia qiaohouensis]|uniref:SURF1-like protein n=1 Tax=Franzmannia qiaohouensis TaxID=1329370 RepID=A0ABU1HEQ3_9GAMM|nr:SURF1 family protein [Halomonas qiaohouensis]MDR5905949.1 SURF1 family protein [Halomonas qiaohouensis]